MQMTIEKRDLFTVPDDYYLCHCISADFALGAGIAKKFAELGVRDELIKHYRHFHTWTGHGQCIFTSATKWGEFNLVTKEKYWHKPALDALQEALYAMSYHPYPLKKIAMPKIGCGLDRLKWQDVERIIKEVFANTDIEILVCDWS